MASPLFRLFASLLLLGLLCTLVDPSEGVCCHYGYASTTYRHCPVPKGGEVYSKYGVGTRICKDCKPPTKNGLWNCGINGNCGRNACSCTACRG